MLEKLQMAPPDPILGLGEAFKKDPRPDKINLSVGVYQDADGKTPVLGVVKEAEQRLLAQETNKSYLSIDGLPEYARHVRELLFGADHEIIAQRRGVTAQTPGGTGGLARGSRFLPAEAPGPAHLGQQPDVGQSPEHLSRRPACRSTSIPTSTRPAQGLDFQALMATLQTIPAGDAICFHASCHNPTGIDPTPEQWRQIGHVLQQRQILPLVDFAYQGFADGIEEDRAGLLQLVAICPEMLICSSFSKNFGLYNERVGALTLVAPTEEAAQIGLSHLKICIRTNYSNPPKHGGAIVATILGDPDAARTVDRRCPGHARSDRRHAAAVRRHAASQRRRAGLLVHHAPARHVLVFRNHARAGRPAAQ